ncbi:MAG: hypothetical protein RL318_2473 [Fibrobacterota bacterium]
MDWLNVLGIDALGTLAKGHVKEISFAMATAFSVVISSPINSLIVKIAGRWNFLVRTGIYMALFVVWYPMLSFGSEKFARYVLSDQKPLTLLFLTATAFFAFGLWADSQRLR